MQPRAVHAGDARAGEALGTAAEVAAVQGVKLSSLAGGCWGDSMAGLKKLGHDSIIIPYSLIYSIIQLISMIPAGKVGHKSKPTAGLTLAIPH